MIIRIRFKKLGGHYHCRVFSAPQRGYTYALCGELVFDEREWPEVAEQLGRAEWLEDGALPPSENSSGDTD